MELEQHHRPGSERTSIVEDLLELASQNRQDAVDAVIEMLADLITHGLKSRFAKKLSALPIWELKTRSRGRAKGGTRVYFFVHQNKAHIVNVEVKQGESPDPATLKEALKVWRKVTTDKEGKA